jgi:hypothetical protein
MGKRAIDGSCCYEHAHEWCIFRSFATVKTSFRALIARRAAATRVAMRTLVFTRVFLPETG